MAAVTLYVVPFVGCYGVSIDKGRGVFRVQGEWHNRVWAVTNSDAFPTRKEIQEAARHFASLAVREKNKGNYDLNAADIQQIVDSVDIVLSEPLVVTAEIMSKKYASQWYSIPDETTICRACYARLPSCASVCGHTTYCDACTEESAAVPRSCHLCA